jgi:hypothetical protein
MDGQVVVIIDNQFLDSGREDSLFLALDNIVDMEEGSLPKPLQVLSTSKVFRINPTIKARLPQTLWKSNKRVPINDQLTADLILFPAQCLNSH